jgi:hypothetical protein
VQLRVNGYSQKLPLLAEKIVDKMRTLEIRQDRFDIFKEKVGSHHATTSWWGLTPPRIVTPLTHTHSPRGHRTAGA